MNWVGGARSRVRQKTERKKQREFFERKRLETKVKKIIRPKSPQERSSRTISKDLLFLQFVSKAHDGNTAAPQRPVKRLKLTEPHNLWPDRNIALPMSPIGQPSAIEFHDASSDTEVLSLFTSHAPRVSTQKISHHTTLESFGPPPLLERKKTTLPGKREPHNPPTEGLSLWTEAVFSKRETASRELDDSSSSLLNESLGVGKRGLVGGRYNQKVARGQAGNLFRVQGERRGEKQSSSRFEVLNRGTKKRSIANAEKSYDRETPFTFNNRPLKKMKNECNRVDMPRTKTSLLDFHASEGLTKQDMLLGGKERDRGHRIIPNTDRSDPSVVAEPAEKVSKGWDSPPPPLKKRASTSTSVTSSVFDENPLSRKARPTSVSTVFNESVLRPIHRQALGRRQPPQTTQHLATDGGGGGSNVKSAFERMMSAFEAFEKTVVKPVEPLHGGLTDQLLPTNEGVGEGVGMFGSEANRDKPMCGEGFGTQSKKWQEFISGFTEPPQPLHTAADKKWEEFTSGIDHQHNPTSTSGEALQSVPDEPCSGDQQQPVTSVTQRTRDCSISTALPATRVSRLGSLSVMNELMCLEEIGSPSIAALASQEISFTPVVCSRQVPDIDATRASIQRCMSENPLKLFLTPTPPSPSGKKKNMTSEKKRENIANLPAASTRRTATESPHDCNDKQLCAGEIVCVGQSECDGSVNTDQTRADKLQNVTQNDECAKSNIHNQDTDDVAASKPLTDTVNDTDLHQTNGLENMTIGHGSDATTVDSGVFQTCQIPVDIQDDTSTVHQPLLLPNRGSQIQDSGINKEDLCLEKCISVAVQCSLDSSSLISPQTPVPRESEDKSTQMFIPPHIDAAIQTTYYTTVDESSVYQCQSNPNTTTVTADQDGVARKAGGSDEVLALRKELDSMQNTVIWQAFMLRLYKM